MRFKFVSAVLATTLLASYAQAQERVWTLDAADEDAFLVYGVPESDDVGISIWCKIGSNKTTLFFPVTWTTLENEATVPVSIVLGEREFKLTGKATGGAKMDGSSIEAPVLEQESAFYDALKNTDRLKLMVGEHKSVFPLLDMPIDGLLKLCQQAPTAE